MAARVTKVWVDAISLTDPKPRVTKVWVDVLSGTTPDPRVTMSWIDVIYMESLAPESEQQQPIVSICT
ncbi:MAG: hypothetical protein KDG50_07100 [Chromatiales bacterium]|nr:hypothetical protein [Chromatiales bacterium]